jgi:hypothetical protein
MRQFVRRHPFLFVGLLTLCLFVGVETLRRMGYAGPAAAGAAPLRVLIVPMYVVWLPFMMLNVVMKQLTGGVAPLETIIWIFGLLAGLLPYVLADHMLSRWRRTHDHREVPPNTR